MRFLLAIAVWVASMTMPTPPIRQLQSGKVTGILRTDSGSPMQGIRVAVEPVSSALDAGLLESISLTDKAGRYVLENVSPGRYRLVTGRIDSPLYHPGVPDSNQATTVLVVAGETTQVPDMVFNRTNIAGRVVDIKTGKARTIKFLALCCDNRPSSQSPSLAALRIIETSLMPISATVNEDGTFRFADVPPGKYFLQANDPGIVPVAQIIEVGRDHVEGFELKVTSGVRVEGTVMDRLSQSVTAVNITLKPDSGNAMFEARTISSAATTLVEWGPTSVGSAAPPVDMLRRVVAETKPRAVMATAAGFSFAGVLPGKYTLEANAPGGNAFSTTIEVGIRDAAVARLDLPFIQVTGRIAESDGSALPRLTGSVRFVSADPVARIVFGFPDDAGRFSVLLAPGSYRLFTDTLNVDSSIESITDGTNDLRAQRFIVDGNRQQQIRIVVAP